MRKYFARLGKLYQAEIKLNNVKILRSLLKYVLMENGMPFR